VGCREQGEHGTKSAEVTVLYTTTKSESGNKSHNGGYLRRRSNRYAAPLIENCETKFYNRERKRRRDYFPKK
jgi:hypothetical protein